MVGGLLMDVFDNLSYVEEEIIDFYLDLAELEIDHVNDLYEREKLIQKIQLLTRKEKSLLVDLMQMPYEEVKARIAEEKISQPMLINLGYHHSAHLFRLESMYESVLGDAGIEYADALNYDLHKITLKFLEYIIHLPEFFSIQSYLIHYKYDLISSDYQLENDMFFHRDLTFIELNSRNMKVNFPSSRFVDYTILVGEAMDMMEQIALVPDNFVDDVNMYVKLVVSTISLLARLAMYDEEQLINIMENFQVWLSGDYVQFEVKEFLYHMVDIFEEIKDSIHFSRL